MNKSSCLMGLMVFGGSVIYIIWGAFHYTDRGPGYLIVMWMTASAGWYAKSVVGEFRTFKSRGKNERNSKSC